MPVIANVDTLTWLSEWYSTQCYEAWAEEFGVSIDTLDNPGWSIKIDLEGTELEDRYFENLKIERSDNDWLFCAVKSKKFKAHCGPKNLNEALLVFRQWAENKNPLHVSQS